MRTGVKVVMGLSRIVVSALVESERAGKAERLGLSIGNRSRRRRRRRRCAKPAFTEGAVR